MTPLDRIRGAARRQPADRVPVAPYLRNRGARVGGVRIGDYCRSGRLMAEAQDRAWEVYGQDAVAHLEPEGHDRRRAPIRNATAMIQFSRILTGWTLMAFLCFARPAAMAAASTGGRSAPAAPALRMVDPKLDQDLFVWTDTCNVYVVRDGAAALLIDLGDGSVLEHLREIGVTRVEWVLFTHHHREQCQGAPRLQGTGARVAGPEAERDLFEKPAAFRKMSVSLGDKFTIHGSSYVRPPIQPIPLDRAFNTNDTFAWHGREFLCLGTPGNSPGGMSYLLRHGDRWIAFSGDVMLEGARMHTWFDTEWDYGFAAGIQALRRSVALLADRPLALLLPSHGPVDHPSQRAVGRVCEEAAAAGATLRARL